MSQSCIYSSEPNAFLWCRCAEGSQGGITLLAYRIGNWMKIAVKWTSHWVRVASAVSLSCTQSKDPNAFLWCRSSRWRGSRQPSGSAWHQLLRALWFPVWGRAVCWHKLSLWWLPWLPRPIWRRQLPGQCVALRFVLTISLCLPSVANRALFFNLFFSHLVFSIFWSIPVLLLSLTPVLVIQLLFFFYHSFF